MLIIIIPFTCPRLPPALGGCPALMELLGVTSGLEILRPMRSVRIARDFHTDCQGLVKKLQHPHVLRRNTSGPGYLLLRNCQKVLETGRTHLR